MNLADEVLMREARKALRKGRRHLLESLEQARNARPTAEDRERLAEGLAEVRQVCEELERASA